MKTAVKSIPDYLKRFFIEYLPIHRQCSPATIASYRDAMRLYLLYLKVERRVAPSRVGLEHFSAQEVLAFLNHAESTRANSARTRNARLTAIRAFVRYLLMLEPLWSSDLQPIMAIPVKRTSRGLVTFLYKEELDALLDAPDPDTWSGRRDRVLFAVMYNTGARVSEVVKAKVADVTLGPTNTMLLHGKGRKERALPLWPDTVKRLRTWLRRDRQRGGDALFPNERGLPMTRSGVEKRLSSAVSSAATSCSTLNAKRISPHTLRHTTAMHLLQAGVDITVIAMWLGHESIETTHIYMTADLAMKERALETLQPPTGGSFRFKPNDELLAFLQSRQEPSNMRT
jgi:integrase/recombinase XerD